MPGSVTLFQISVKDHVTNSLRAYIESPSDIVAAAIGAVNSDVQDKKKRIAQAMRDYVTYLAAQPIGNDVFNAEVITSIQLTANLLGAGKNVVNAAMQIYDEVRKNNLAANDLEFHVNLMGQLRKTFHTPASSWQITKHPDDKACQQGNFNTLLGNLVKEIAIIRKNLSTFTRLGKPLCDLPSNLLDRDPTIIMAFYLGHYFLDYEIALQRKNIDTERQTAPEPTTAQSSGWSWQSFQQIAGKVAKATANAVATAREHLRDPKLKEAKTKLALDILQTIDSKIAEKIDRKFNGALSFAAIKVAVEDILLDLEREQTRLHNEHRVEYRAYIYAGVYIPLGYKPGEGELTEAMRQISNTLSRLVANQTLFDPTADVFAVDATAVARITASVTPSIPQATVTASPVLMLARSQQQNTGVGNVAPVPASATNQDEEDPLASLLREVNDAASNDDDDAPPPLENQAATANAANTNAAATPSSTSEATPQRRAILIQRK